MARIRSIKPTFFTDEELQDLEIANPGAYCMMVYAGLWGHCSKDGVFEYKPRTLKLHILPFLPFEMVDTLELLVGAGFIRIFTANGRKYGYVPNFVLHQRISGKEAGASPDYPSPPDHLNGVSSGEQSADMPENHNGSTEEAPGKHRGSTGEAPGTAGKGKGKGKEKEKEKETSKPTNSSACVRDVEKQPPKSAFNGSAEVMIDRCWEENRQRIYELFPHLMENFEVERATCVAYYRSRAAPVDPYPLVLKWCSRARVQPEDCRKKVVSLPLSRQADRQRLVVDQMRRLTGSDDDSK